MNKSLIYTFITAGTLAFMGSPALAAGVLPGFEPVDIGVSGNANSTYGGWPNEFNPVPTAPPVIPVASGTKYPASWNPFAPATPAPAPTTVGPTKYPANWHPF